MDYKEKYEEALDRAKAGKPMDEVFPELKESEDERIRKLLVWQVHRNIEDDTNDLAQSVYDGVKGHDPDLEESIEDWKKCLAYLEKQKEQKPAEWSEEDEQYLLICKNALNKYQRSDHWDANIISKWLEERLNSLRPQPHWKPSEEQMEALMKTITWLVEIGNHTDSSTLADLRRNLQKLM